MIICNGQNLCFTVIVHELGPLLGSVSVHQWPVSVHMECRFFLFCCINFLCHTVSVSQFRAIASLTRALVLANITAFLVVLMAFLFGGLIIAKREIAVSIITPVCCRYQFRGPLHL